MECANAMDNGNLGLLQQLREAGHYWDENTCANAARGGHLEILEWARAQGCPWDEWTCAYAAIGGHLEVLQWARAQGCPWDENTCSYAATRGHLDVLIWIYENKGPFHDMYVQVHENCRQFWNEYAIPYWSQGIFVPVGNIPKPAKRDTPRN